MNEPAPQPTTAPGLLTDGQADAFVALLLAIDDRILAAEQAAIEAARQGQHQDHDGPTKR